MEEEKIEEVLEEVVEEAELAVSPSEELEEESI